MDDALTTELPSRFTRRNHQLQHGTRESAHLVFRFVRPVIEVEEFGTGGSCFRPPALPFVCEGRMVAVDGLAVREGQCPYPGLRNAGVAVRVGAEVVKELRAQTTWARRVGVTDAVGVLVQ